MLFMAISANRRKPFANIEILTGKSMGPSGTADKTMLVGNCMIKANRRDSRIKEAIFAKGCPSTFEEVMGAFVRCGVEVDIEKYQS